MVLHDRIIYIAICMATIMFTGDRHYTPNVHMLLHLPDTVRSLGQLWAHSAFSFEDMNGWLSELYPGTRDPQKQITIWHVCVQVSVT